MRVWVCFSLCVCVCVCVCGVCVCVCVRCVGVFRGFNVSQVGCFIATLTDPQIDVTDKMNPSLVASIPVDGTNFALIWFDNTYLHAVSSNTKSLITLDVNQWQLTGTFPAKPCLTEHFVVTASDKGI